MIEINLLPWREIKIEKEKKKFLNVFLTELIITITILFLVNFYINSLLDKQSQRNQRLRDEITLFNVKIKEIQQIKNKKEILVSRINFMHKLRMDNLLIIHLFDEVTRLVPYGIYLSRLQKNDDKIILQGFFNSNNSVSQLIQGIKQSEWMINPILIEIKKTESTRDNEFKLNFILKPQRTLNLIS